MAEGAFWMRVADVGGLAQRTGLRLLYLLLAFPLGLFYFIFLVTGLSVGGGLVIILWGLPILLGVAVACWWFTKFERWLAIQLLGARIGSMRRRSLDGLSRTEQLKAHFGNRVTWTGLVYLFATFPFGIAAFVVVATGLSFIATGLAAPVLYSFTDLSIGGDAGNWSIDTLPEALATFALALFVVLPLTVLLVNGMAVAWRAFAELMLGYTRETPGPDEAAAAPPVTPALPPAMATPRDLVQTRLAADAPATNGL
jgi:hypothetical protein